jgi:renalase
MTIAKVAIIGAGLAGLAAAKTLVAHGVDVRLFDKGRSAGGRMATRRVEVEGQPLTFDHGAQYLTARRKVFQATLDAVGAKPWPQPGRFVGMPRMSQVARALAEGLDLVTARHVLAIEGERGAWRLRHAAAAQVKPGRPAPTEGLAEEGPFDAVVLALPSPQAVDLLRDPAPHLAALADRAVMTPCWTLMVALPERPNLPDWLQLEGGPIAWLARDSSKPGRHAEDECWVIQASAAWTREHLELPAVEVARLLFTALARLAGVAALPTPRYLAAHRWRYALTEVALGAPCVWDADLALGAAGDWCLGARAEDAVESGMAVAAALRKA